MSKKVLITGATGLIGTALCKKFIEEGYTVHYFTRDKKKIENRKDYQGFFWNPKEGIIDDKAFEGVSTIIHLAGAPISKRWTSGYKNKIISSRIEPMNLMYDRLKEIPHSVEHFISASGINIYPSSQTKLYTEEDQERDNNFITSVVEVWEDKAWEFKQLGMEVSKVRTGLVLSTQGGVLPTLAKPIKFGIGSPLGNGKQWQSWIHIDDIVGIYFFLTRHSMEGIFNAVAPNPVKNKRLLRRIAKKLNKPLWMPKVPKFVLKTVLGEMGSLAVDSQLVSAGKIREVGYRFKYPKLEAALNDLYQ